MDVTRQDAGGQWFDGAPLNVPSEIVLIDLLIYRRMRCPECRKRGMKAVPQHTTDGRCRIVCSCRTCRHVEEC